MAKKEDMVIGYKTYYQHVLQNTLQIHRMQNTYHKAIDFNVPWSQG